MPRPSSPKLVTGPIPAASTLALRQSVLRADRPVADSVFPGDDDPLVLHAGAYIGDRLVSVGSIYHEPRPIDAPGDAKQTMDHVERTSWRLRGMATAPDARGIGAGAAVLELCSVHARQHGATLLWCNARVGAIGFYERAGWTVLGTEFDIPTIGPHFVMERRLAD